MARLSFAWRMLQARWADDNALCPYCESCLADRLQRKWLLVEARRCLHCGLIFRWPTDPAKPNRVFYESDYEGQQATEIPDAASAVALAAKQFAGSQWDRADRIAFVKHSLGDPDGRALLDFGCSWGYATNQYKHAGWTARGFEIDRRRAAFGCSALDLDIVSDLAEYDGSKFDVIIADHSLEHVPRINNALQAWTKLAARDAVLVVFVPNGSCRNARRLGVRWGPFIGEAHTVAFTMEWFARNLPRHGFRAEFRRQDGTLLPAGEYLDDCAEICMVARAISSERQGA